MRNRRKFKLNKSHVKGHKVNDLTTYRNKHKQPEIFHSIEDDLAELDLYP